MTQYKDKVANKRSINIGLFTYPILMAADILLYHADVVPVGDDQKQHIELARNIANVVNRKSNKEVLKIPSPFIRGIATRVMSLKNGIKKMSKSDISDASRINILDTPEVIRYKIKKSKTDSINKIFYDRSARAEVSNLINIYSGLTNISHDKIIEQYNYVGLVKFKQDLTDVIIDTMSPISSEYYKIMQDIPYIKSVLSQGAERARIIANQTLTEVKKIFGLL